MGTWGAGPLDNETADDMIDEMQDMSPETRLASLVDIVQRAGTTSNALHSRVLPEEVVVAACIVVASLDDASDFPWLEQHPEFGQWLSKPLPPTLPTQASDALHALVLHNDNFWSSWVADSDRVEARVAIEQLTRALES